MHACRFPGSSQDSGISLDTAIDLSTWPQDAFDHFCQALRSSKREQHDRNEAHPVLLVEPPVVIGRRANPLGDFLAGCQQPEAHLGVPNGTLERERFLGVTGLLLKAVTLTSTLLTLFGETCQTAPSLSRSSHASTSAVVDLCPLMTGSVG